MIFLINEPLLCVSVSNWPPTGRRVTNIEFSGYFLFGTRFPDEIIEIKNVGPLFRYRWVPAQTFARTPSVGAVGFIIAPIGLRVVFRARRRFFFLLFLFYIRPDGIINNNNIGRSRRGRPDLSVVFGNLRH